MTDNNNSYNDEDAAVRPSRVPSVESKSQPVVESKVEPVDEDAAVRPNRVSSVESNTEPVIESKVEPVDEDLSVRSQSSEDSSVRSQASDDDSVGNSTRHVTVQAASAQHNEDRAVKRGNIFIINQGG